MTPSCIQAAATTPEPGHPADRFLTATGSPSLMTRVLRVTVDAHVASDEHVLMKFGDELLTFATDRELASLAGKLSLEVRVVGEANPVAAARRR